RDLHSVPTRRSSDLTLHHLPAVFNGVKRRHHNIFFAITVPGEDLHLCFFLKACPDVFFTNPIIAHILPAVTLFHILLQIVLMSLPHCFHKTLCIQCFLQTRHPLSYCFFSISLHFYIDGSIDLQSIIINIIRCPIRFLYILQQISDLIF